jgi:hypothetical protein
MRPTQGQSAYPKVAYLLAFYEPHLLIYVCSKPTGTFFCDRTTAQSLPRTPTDVMFAAVIALNAYSVTANV